MIGFSMGVITQHVVGALLLWHFEDNWQIRCESSNNHTENFATKPSVLVEQGNLNGSLDHGSMKVLRWAKIPTSVPTRLPHIVHSAPAAVDEVSPTYKARLATQGAVSTSNFRAPTAVYVAVPLVSFIVGFLSIYAYCSWKKNMLKNRNMKMDKVAETRRRISLKPGASAVIEARSKAQKYGLYARTQKSEHDAAALITFSAAITGLATELEMVDNIVLEYKSPNAGEAIPEFHSLTVEDDAYSVTINPLFNSLQSGVCGYVLSSVKNPVLRFTDERRTSIPLRIEHSAYVAPADPSSPDPQSLESESESEDHEDETEYSESEGTMMSGTEETSTAVDSPSSPTEESTSETDTSASEGESSKYVIGDASNSRTTR